MIRLLVADADAALRENTAALARTLLPGALVAEAGSWAEAVDRTLALRPHGALVALRLGERSGLELIQRLLAAGMETAFCVTAPSGEGDLIRQAMRAGARDYLPAAPSREELRGFFQRALPLEEDEPISLTDPILGVDYASLSPLTARVLLMARESFRHPPVTLASVAESLHMNSKYVGRVFLAQTGMKFSQYLLACRMEEARRLVEGTREKISVIAGMVGYSQPNRFYVHFQSYFGVSPSALRRAGSGQAHGEARR